MSDYRAQIMRGEVPARESIAQKFRVLANGHGVTVRVLDDTTVEVEALPDATAEEISGTLNSAARVCRAYLQDAGGANGATRYTISKH